LHVVVAAPDELYGRAAAAGATVVRDPQGNVWSVGTWYG
jgi:uncharacterized glyoxalase superfamily protein PhnB